MVCGHVSEVPSVIPGMQQPQCTLEHASKHISQVSLAPQRLTGVHSQGISNHAWFDGDSPHVGKQGKNVGMPARIAMLANALIAQSGRISSINILPENGVQKLTVLGTFASVLSSAEDRLFEKLRCTLPPSHALKPRGKCWSSGPLAACCDR
mmetsp:Transcript_65017/g.186892  ORF Transcript_65017/g.186892 Transcript_65017/m.186892 type:complete len:152 (-) Transcript_65017:228-683(-)